MNTVTFAQSTVQRRENCATDAVNDNCLSVLPEVAANNGQVERGLAVIFGVFAAVAVLVIIIAAINYAGSEGNPEKLSKAKQTIIYALIGLVISLSAEAIVLTLLTRL